METLSLEQDTLIFSDDFPDKAVIKFCLRGECSGVRLLMVYAALRLPFDPDGNIKITARTCNLYQEHGFFPR